MSSQLFSIYEKIQTDRVKESQKGLTDLKYLLASNKTLDLNDKGYQKLFEVIFSATHKHKAHYVKSQKGEYAVRFALCGSVLRAAVEHKVECLRKKSVRAVVQHIITTSPHSGGIWQPISLDYTKTLKAIIEHAPHLEHFTGTEWQEIVKFCCEGTETELTLLEGDSDEESVQDYRGTPRPVRAPISRESSSLSARVSLSVGRPPRLKSETEELMLCLELLLQAPNAAIKDTAQMTGSAIFGFLTTQPNVTRVHPAAFSCLNSILANTSANNIALTRRFAEQIPAVISRLWDTKSTLGLKEHMITSLIYLVPHLQPSFDGSRHSESVREGLEGLLDNIIDEYSNRMSRDQLQLEDIEFPDPRKPVHYRSNPLALRSFMLRSSGKHKTEQPWMILQLIASLATILDTEVEGVRDAMDVSEPEDSGTRKAKRRKLQLSRFEGILREANSSHSTKKLAALQVLPFLLDEGNKSISTTINVQDWLRIMTDLCMTCSEDNTGSSSWAILGIASGAFLPPVLHISTSSFWQQAWQLCIRHATNQATCRAACHLMRVILTLDLVPYSSISQSIDTMIQSLDLNGPAILVDSALAIWPLILEKRSTVLHSMLFQPGEKLAQWLLSKWRPLDGLDRATATTFNHMLKPMNMIEFLLICCGRRRVWCTDNPFQFRLGAIGLACVRAAQLDKLLEFLLLKEKESKFLETKSDSISQIITSANDVEYGNKQHTVQLQIIEFLDRELGTIQDKWNDLVLSQSKTITPDLLQNYAGTLITASVLMSETSFRSTKRGDNPIEKLEAMVKDLASYLTREDCTDAHIESILESVSPLLPSIHQMIQFDDRSREEYHGPFGNILSSVSKVMEIRLKVAEKTVESQDSDEMDIDDDFDIPLEKPRRGEKNPQTRTTLEITYSNDMAKHSTISKLRIFRMSCKDKERESRCNRVSQYLTQIPVVRLLMSQGVVKEFLIMAEVMSPEDTASVLDYIGDAVLQDYDFERCETALEFMIEALRSLIPIWLPDGSDKSMKDFCVQIYDWLVTVILENKLTSYNLRISMAKLLQCILSVNKLFKGKRSARTDLFTLLKDQDVRVKFFVSDCMPRLLELYPIGQHSSVYADIHVNLERDADWVEGLATRCYTLAKLATASYATKRRTVYYLFETALNSRAEGYATQAIKNIAKDVGLDGPRALFKIFSTQLIFSWIKEHGIATMPFRVGGYSSLKELYEDMEEELVAQLYMRDEDGELRELARDLGTTVEELIPDSFHRIIAYGTAWPMQAQILFQTQCKRDEEEAARTGKEKAQREPPKTPPPIESRIKKRIGERKYIALYDKNFPLIIATLFQAMEQDGTSEKLVSRDATLAAARHIMKCITDIAASTITLAEPLDPSFKLKVVLSSMHHICNRLRIDEGNLWSPAMFTFVARKLLDTIDPGLGPLHACAVVRKIRLLISLAGRTVHEGYPLEMIIHGLRPFIVDVFCAEDTVGILQYLFIHGKGYLQTNPTFVVGTFLSIMASLSSFIGNNFVSQQDASQLRGSQNTAQTFHSWLCEYLSNYTFTNMSPENGVTFRSIVESAISFKSNDSAPGTQDGELLRVLLKDEEEVNGLLDDVSRHLAFSLLGSRFECPQNFRHDTFGSDEESKAISKALLRTCRKYNVSNSYLLWSARVLGRAYASSGSIHSEWTQEAEFNVETELPITSNGFEIVPKVAIFRKLRGLLFSEDRREVGLAETSIVDIFHQEQVIGNTSTSEHTIPPHLQKALKWATPPDIPPKVMQGALNIVNAGHISCLPVNDWVKRFAIGICAHSSRNAVTSRLGPLLQSVDGLAKDLFPYLVHYLLLDELEVADTGARAELSSVFRECFKECTELSIPHLLILIKTILYLRTQERPKEKTKLARDSWIDVDYLDLSKAAYTCKMFKTALLFAEIHCSQHKVSYTEFTDLLLDIYRNVDDPDSFYGVDQAASFDSVLGRLEYEKNGWKSLSFRGAQMESSMRLRSQFSNESSVGAIEAFNTLGLNGLSHSLLQGGAFVLDDEATVENLFESAWKLENWQLPCPTSNTGRASTLYKALQGVNNNTDTKNISHHLDDSFLGVIKQITAGKQTGHSLGASIRTLSILTEVEEILVSGNSAQLEETWSRFQSRLPWMETASFSDVEEILSARQATFSSIAKREHLRNAVQIDLRTSRLYEAKALLGVCSLARVHKVLQHSLSAATHLNDVVSPCKMVEMDISAAATLETANVLWDQGETIPAIRTLQRLEKDPSLSRQTLTVGRAKILANLGHWISEARLEKPEVIMSQYLEKAINSLHEGTRLFNSNEAGRVFHEFASFCDQQLKNPDNIEDYQRALKLRENKQTEIREIEELMKTATGAKFNTYSSFQNKAKVWLKLDDLEFGRLQDNREAFLEKSISNYLRCLEVCDTYDGDAVRFCALWLEYSSNPKANQAAKCTLESVPSRKFVSLMSQLSSRLLDADDEFQKLLSPLIIRITREHPYHALYQLMALTKIKNKDRTSESRHKAAIKVAGQLKREKSVAHIMHRVVKSIQVYHSLAMKTFERQKGRSKYLIRSVLPEFYRDLEKEIPGFQIPPPTMNIEIRPDCDYTHVPHLLKFQPEVRIAAGASAPKIIGCQDSAGQFYKMLVKGGNDDLRQDAIMEQVFEQVSHLLQKNRPTRQRNLTIRAYKVVPLTTSSGIIEFVLNTIPLHDYLLPAHDKYYPSDWKANKCRQIIYEAQQKTRNERVKAYREVMAKFSPVMRYFFMHNFNGPDEWFRSRLAYTRSTAAISILGHVLGLGDRHGHNILLDERTGEVVHIDLGVAFEQGRVLPVPEVVPFRLTRDIVDGMGITKTEGVFRRCCEFTLSVLREESYNITTILDVLRYDPLYSWTISPLRMQRMQANNVEVKKEEAGVSSENNKVVAEKKNNTAQKEESEAERALMVVSKKLSKTLSVSATVNELIQQATDERNLAVLYCGWAAFA